MMSRPPDLSFPGFRRSTKAGEAAGVAWGYHGRGGGRLTEYPIAQTKSPAAAASTNPAPNTSPGSVLENIRPKPAPTLGVPTLLSAGRSMSALPPIATGERTSREVRVGPNSGHRMTFGGKPSCRRKADCAAIKRSADPRAAVIEQSSLEVPAPA
jgi:hypothetical protein